jgi:DNA-binding transcriptional MerR regulator
VEAVAIPNRPVFRAQEVCELAGLQPYVLRTWEAEFPDLGVSKSSQGPRLYRRADVERVLLIKHLLFVDGLTVAGARRKMTEDGLLAAPTAHTDDDVTALADEVIRQELQRLRRELQWMLGVLSGGAPVPPVGAQTSKRSQAAASAARPLRARPAAQKSGRQAAKAKKK